MYQNISLQSPEIPLKPTANVKFPNSIGSCNDIESDASQSFYPDRRPSSYESKVIEEFRKESINKYLSNKKRK